jgi:acetylornithine deacetylase/succinyl-diaminopimelate desuccinylase-like protein
LFDVVHQAQQRGIKCEGDLFQEGRSGATDADGVLGRALSKSIRTATGRSARFELCPGVLETRHYTALGVPALAYGPGLLSVAHGPHEFVAIEKLLACAEVYALTAMRLLSSAG